MEILKVTGNCRWKTINVNNKRLVIKILTTLSINLLSIQLRSQSKPKAMYSPLICSTKDRHRIEKSLVYLTLQLSYMRSKLL